MPDTAGFSIVDPPKPEIAVVAGELDLLATRAELAIRASRVPVYQRGDHLVRPVTFEVPAAGGRTTIAAGLKEVTRPSTLDAMAQTAAYTRFDARRRCQTPCDPPSIVADVILSRAGLWTLPSIAGVISTPTLRADGSVLANPGYDPATRLFLVGDDDLAMPPVQTTPTEADARRALALLDGLLANFPFVTEIDRAVALSALLTPVCRGCMVVAPMHAFRAATAGTGKSYLADLASAVATGRPCPVAAAGRDADEVDKRIVALLLAGFPVISLDNINGELGSDLLCQAVERPTVRLRKLGGSEISEIETRATVFATGNGLRVRGDMTRRTLVCDLDAKMERPELRSFAFDPVDRVLFDRGRYVAAALTVVRAFIVSGARPSMSELGSYRDYSNTVRGALVWLGYGDPCSSMEQAREDDPELGELRDVMTAWRRAFGESRTVKQLRETAERDTSSDLCQVLLAVAGGRHGIDNQALGRWLRARKGRIVTLSTENETALQCRLAAEPGQGGIMRWRVEALR